MHFTYKYTHIRTLLVLLYHIQTTIAELNLNLMEAKDVEILPDSIILEILYKRLAFLNLNEPKISQDKEEEMQGNHNVKRIKGA